MRVERVCSIQYRSKYTSFNGMCYKCEAVRMSSGVHTGRVSGFKPPQGQKKKKIVLLLMTCNIFVVSLLRFELEIYNYTNIMIIK
jgi:hypothetical protein